MFSWVSDGPLMQPHQLPTSPELFGSSSLSQKTKSQTQPTLAKGWLFITAPVQRNRKGEYKIPSICESLRPYARLSVRPDYAEDISLQQLHQFTQTQQTCQPLHFWRNN